MNSNFFENRANIATYDNDEYSDVMCCRIHNSSFKGAGHVHSRYMVELAIFTKGLIFNRILKESLITEFCGMMIPRNHKLYNVLDHKTKQMFEAGIINHYIDFFKKFLDPNFYKSLRRVTPKYLEVPHVKLYKEGPQILTLEHLEAGFVIWLAALSIAVGVYALEWLPRFKDYLIIELVLKAFYHQKMLEAKAVGLYPKTDWDRNNSIQRVVDFAPESVNEPQTSQNFNKHDDRDELVVVDL